MGGASKTMGVVTVTYNSASVLQDFFSSINAQLFQDFRLYVIDNNSRDSSADISEDLACCDLLVIRNPDNVGVAEGNNQGIELAMRDGCSHVLLLNNDTVFGPNLFQGLLQESARHPIVAPKIHCNDDVPTLWFAGGLFRKARGFVGIHIGEGEPDRGQYDLPGATEYAPTCCMLVAKEVFQQIGRMDARFFVYYDDTDFCLRLFRGGVEVWYAPSLALRHKVGSLTGGIVSDFSARMGARNKVYFVRKNFSAVLSAVYLTSFFLYLVGRLIILKDSPRLFKIRVRAFVEGFGVSRMPPMRL